MPRRAKRAAASHRPRGVSFSRPSESADVNGRMYPSATDAGLVKRPPEYASSSLGLKRDAKSASRASADATVQEHRSKEVAHSSYRVDGLRRRAQRLKRAHLPTLMLLEPLLVAPALLQTPVQVAAQLARRGDRRLRLALGAQQLLIVMPDRTGRQLQALRDLDQDPLEPRAPRSAHAAVRRLAAGTLGARDQTRVRGQLVARVEAVDRADLRQQQRGPEGPDPRPGLEQQRSRGVLHHPLHPPVP